MLHFNLGNMSEINKKLLIMGNSAIARGDYQTFLSICSDDTVWEFVGDRTLRGKAEVRAYMAGSYLTPPVFKVSHLIAEGEMLTAVGEISLLGRDGKWTEYHYCDVWEFRDGLLETLRAFVVEKIK